MDFVYDIEFSDNLNINLEIYEENLKTKVSGKDQKPSMVEPIMPFYIVTLYHFVSEKT